MEIFLLPGEAAACMYIPDCGYYLSGVCVCVCVRACTCVCMCVCVHAHVCACACVHAAGSVRVFEQEEGVCGNALSGVWTVVPGGASTEWSYRQQHQGERVGAG